MLDWDHLKTVLAVARGGTLTAAARELGVDQTTAGRRLSQAEHQFGATLFLRVKSGFIPTDSGVEVIRAARDVEARLAHLNDNLELAGASATGVVRILGNSWMLKALAGPALRQFLDNHPALELRFSSRLPPTPVHGNTTLALWFDAEAQLPAVARPFARVPYSAFRARSAGVGSPDWAIFRDDVAEGPSFTRQIARRLGKDARIRMTATDAEILRNAALSGIGKAILPLCLGQASGELEAVPGFERVERVLHVHLVPDLTRTRRVQAVLEWLSATLPDAIGATMLAKDGNAT